MIRIDLDAVRYWKFPAGEIGVRYDKPLPGGSLKLWSCLRSSDDVIRLLMVNDAIRRSEPHRKIYAVIPYVPYAQQDRLSTDGEALSAKVMADLINGCGFTKVSIYHPHSDVIGALINRVDIHNNTGFVWWALEKLDLVDKPFTFISPDAGALKNTFKLADQFSKSSVYCAQKRRDVKTGAVETKDITECFTSTDCVIVDDVIVGGQSYLKLTSDLKRQGARSVHLVASHGIFSRGLEPLYAAGVDTIWTTDSYYLDQPLRGLDLDSKEQVYKLYNEM